MLPPSGISGCRSTPRSLTFRLTFQESNCTPTAGHCQIHKNLETRGGLPHRIPRFQDATAVLVNFWGASIITNACSRISSTCRVRKRRLVMSANPHRPLHYGGSAPATPGFNTVAPEWLFCFGAAHAAPAVPAAESTLGSHPCVALSSAQVLPEWTTATSPYNDFSADGDNPLNFVSHSRGSLQIASPLIRLCGLAAWRENLLRGH